MSTKQTPGGKVLIAQGGGPTAVINQSLVGATLAARPYGLTVYGARHGVRGIVDEDLVDLSEIVELVAARPERFIIFSDDRSGDQPRS